MVMEKGASEDRRVLEALNRKYAQILDDLEVKYHEQRSQYLEGVTKRALQDKNKLLSKTESEIQKKIIIKKNELFNRLMTDLKSAIMNFTESTGYAAYFKEKFEKAMQDFEGEDDVLVGVKAFDVDLLPINMRSQIDDTIIGGFYLVKNGRVKYDYTLNTELEHIMDDLGWQVNALFEDDEEIQNESE